MLILSRLHFENFILFKNKLWSYSYSLLNDYIYNTYLTSIIFTEQQHLLCGLLFYLGNFPNVNSMSQQGKEGPICFRASQRDNAVDGSRISISVVSGKVFNPQPASHVAPIFRLWVLANLGLVGIARCLKSLIRSVNIPPAASLLPASEASCLSEN